jgi:hypothetical protein
MLTRVNELSTARLLPLPLTQAPAEGAPGKLPLSLGLTKDTFEAASANGVQAQATAARARPVLQQGASGASVKELQQLLNRENRARLTADGQFGPATTAAVKAYQLSRGLVADGVVGEQTWNALISHKPPVSRPAPSEFARKILEFASREMGYREGANNRNKFSTFFGRPPEPWCADFVSYCATKAGIRVNNASAGGIQRQLQAQGNWRGKTGVQPGDVVTFDWNRDGVIDHIGLVKSVSGGRITTIEGNSGNMVKSNSYSISDPRVVGFGHIR